MAAKTVNFGSVELSPDTPTELTFAQLSDWVIWQFPRTKSEWMCGAVHPPQPEYGWLPALINPYEKRLSVYGHQSKLFETPEEAAEWIASVPDGDV
jgi:hypothetical protein